MVLLLFIYKDGFGIKWLMKIDMPLNKETETKNVYRTYAFINFNFKPL